MICIKAHLSVVHNVCWAIWCKWQQSV